MITISRKFCTALLIVIVILVAVAIVVLVSSNGKIKRATVSSASPSNSTTVPVVASRAWVKCEDSVRRLGEHPHDDLVSLHRGCP